MSTIDLFLKCKKMKMIKALLFAGVFLLLPLNGFAVTGIDQKVFEQLQKAQEAAEAENFVVAHQILDGMLGHRLNDHEAAQAKNLKASIYTIEKKYDKALPLFEEVVAIEDIPEGLRENGYTVLMQLYMAREDYAKALDYSKKLLFIKKQPDSNLLDLRGQCFFQMEDYPSAEESINQAITIEQSLGNYPKENWLLMLNAIAHVKSNYAAMVPVLNQLIRYYPKDRYVYNLAAVLGQLGKQSEQLALMESLYDAGYLTQKTQIMLLAQLFVAEGVPVKAALVLEKSLARQSGSEATGQFEAEQKDLELLGQAWVLAREPDKAVSPMAQAAAMAKDGEAYLRLAYTYNSLGDWSGVAQAVKHALDKGSLRDKGNALVLLGMAQYRLKQFNQSIETFANARGIKSVSAMSNQWLTFVQGQKEKFDLAGSEI